VSKKLPPPDNEGNLLGRMSRLKSQARSHAQLELKESDGDPKTVFAKHVKKIDKELVALRKRLAKVRGVEEPSKAPEKPQKPEEESSQGRVPADYDDLLARLGEL